MTPTNKSNRAARSTVSANSIRTTKAFRKRRGIIRDGAQKHPV